MVPAYRPSSHSTKGSHMRKTLIGLAGLTLVCGAIAVPTLASSTVAGRTMTLTGVVTSFRPVLDAKPTGQSAGDIATVTGNLLRSGKAYGRYHGVCTQISKSTSQCAFTLGLPDGQILIQSSYGPGFNTGNTAREPIIGGSGAYKGARGQDIGTETDNTHATFRLELLP